MRSNMYCHTLTLHYYGYYSTNGDTMKLHDVVLLHDDKVDVHVYSKIPESAY